jgi:hypothetical protein
VAAAPRHWPEPAPAKGSGDVQEGQVQTRGARDGPLPPRAVHDGAARVAQHMESADQVHQRRDCEPGPQQIVVAKPVPNHHGFSLGRIVRRHAPAQGTKVIQGHHSIQHSPGGRVSEVFSGISVSLADSCEQPLACRSGSRASGLR